MSSKAVPGGFRRPDRPRQGRRRTRMRCRSRAAPSVSVGSAGRLELGCASRRRRGIPPRPPTGRVGDPAAARRQARRAGRRGAAGAPQPRGALHARGVGVPGRRRGPRPRRGRGGAIGAAARPRAARGGGIELPAERARRLLALDHSRDRPDPLRHPLLRRPRACPLPPAARRRGDGRRGLVRAAAALEEHHAGELALVFPTIKHLESLLRVRTPRRRCEAAAAARSKPVLPKVVGEGDEQRMVLPGEPDSTRRAQESAMTETLPQEVRDVFERFITCEYTTVDASRQPITWPVTPYYERAGRRSTSRPGSAIRRRPRTRERNPRVACCSPTRPGPGSTAAIKVLVQGTATMDDADLEANRERYWRESGEKLPATKKMHPPKPVRGLFNWYYTRIYVQVRPERVFVWPDGDLAREPTSSTPMWRRSAPATARSRPRSTAPPRRRRPGTSGWTSSASTQPPSSAWVAPRRLSARGPGPDTADRPAGEISDRARPAGLPVIEGRACLTGARARPDFKWQRNMQVRGDLVARASGLALVPAQAGRGVRAPERASWPLPATTSARDRASTGQTAAPEGALGEDAPPGATRQSARLRREGLQPRVPGAGLVDVEVVLLHLATEAIEDAARRVERLLELLARALPQPPEEEELLIGDAEVDLGGIRVIQSMNAGLKSSRRATGSWSRGTVAMKRLLKSMLSNSTRRREWRSSVSPACARSTRR